MNNKLGTKININADASQACNEIGKFEAGFTRTLNGLSKTLFESKKIRALARESSEGAKTAKALVGANCSAMDLKRGL